MPTAENAQLDYEAGQNFTAMVALTDSGDHISFTSAASLWSGRSGFTPDVKPNGLITGGAITPAAAAGTDDVDVAAITCNLNGVETSVSAAADVQLTRDATNAYQIHSITVNNAGAIAVVAGTAHASAFSDTRDAAGGPPLIPTDSIEIGQVRLTSTAAAVVDASEIFQVVGVHQERFDFPLWNEKPESGSIEFLSALPTIHTGGVAKAVHAEYYTPLFSQVSLASDFTAPETSHSVSSTPIYGTTLGASSASLGQGGFTAYVQDGVTDPLVALKNETLWFRFYPDKYKTPHLLCQGKLGIARTWPAGDNQQAACTISAQSEGVEKAS